MNSRMYKLATRSFTDELKTEIVRRLQSGESVETLAHRLCVVPAMLEGWREEYESAPPKKPRRRRRRKKKDGVYIKDHCCPEDGF